LGSVRKKAPATWVQRCDAGGVQERLRTLNHGSELEQDATRVRIGLQDGGKQCPLAPTHVDTEKLAEGIPNTLWGGQKLQRWYRR